MKSRPVIITFSILAALQVMTASAALGDVIGKDTFSLFALVVAAVQVGMTFYVQNSVTPIEDVAAYVSKDGPVVAGPAAGIQNGSPATVIPTGDVA